MESPEIHYCLQNATGCHVTRAPDYIDEELYNKLVAMKRGKVREDYLADLRARLTPDQVQAATTRLDAAALNGLISKKRFAFTICGHWWTMEVCGHSPSWMRNLHAVD